MSTNTDSTNETTVETPTVSQPVIENPSVQPADSTSIVMEEPTVSEEAIEEKKAVENDYHNLLSRIAAKFGNDMEIAKNWLETKISEI